MATARGIAARRHGMALVSGDPDTGPVLTASPAEVAHGVTSNLNDVAAGRVSLGMLMGLVVGVVLFYVWTNSIQGGG